MYSTCIFCQTNLGTNEAIEHFPVGRRLVFDSARGRLWVVCRRCERWNLSPIEERWEAIEECERLFSNTRLRVSTDNIGLARISEGLELVRVGTPLRPEMAAWRYGDQFGRRRRKHLMLSGAGVAAVAGFMILGPATGIIAGSSWGIWNVFNIAHTAYQQRRVRARLNIPGFPESVAIRVKQLTRVAIIDTDDGWGLRVPFRAPLSRLPSDALAAKTSLFNADVEYSIDITGTDALRAAGRLLPAMNASGAKREQVNEAVRIISQETETSRLFSRYTEPSRWLGAGVVQPQLRYLGSLPNEVRLALEMAAHEDSERRALEGELALLEEAWRQAEEIAGIADDLFVGDDTRARLSALKHGESA